MVIGREAKNVGIVRQACIYITSNIMAYNSVNWRTIPLIIISMRNHFLYTIISYTQFIRFASNEIFSATFMGLGIIIQVEENK